MPNPSPKNHLKLRASLTPPLSKCWLSACNPDVQPWSLAHNSIERVVALFLSIHYVLHAKCLPQPFWSWSLCTRPFLFATTKFCTKWNYVAIETYLFAIRILTRIINTLTSLSIVVCPSSDMPLSIYARGQKPLGANLQYVVDHNHI